MEIHVSVRELVEFILREGNIDNRRTVGAENAMQEGGRIHRMIQKRMGATYHAEVSLKYSYDAGDYTISVEGRADGIIDKENDSLVVIDEIKGTYKELYKIKQAVPVHLAQAKCYAYIYATQQSLDKIGVRMTYCNMDTEEIKYFHEEYERSELEEWFQKLMKEYRKWADFQFEWREKRTQSIKKLRFPFAYRPGQKELATYVYQTIYHKRKLFLEAPTGVGKTLSTVFPTVKSMGEGLTEKIFYLTAKTITRTVAENCLTLLRQQDLRLKSVTITAKEKICPLEETECNPEHCPYAKGHFDRINDAMYDLLIHEDAFTREKIEEYAQRYQVCPFEMCLDMSLFSDVVVCDYNYVFDPKVYLKRFFAEGIRNQYTFLIDEAHNLVERGREMYSAMLVKEDFLRMKKLVKDESPKMERQLQKCNQELLSLKRQCVDYKEEEMIASFVMALTRLYSTMDDYLDGHEDSPIRKDILDFFFQIGQFLNIYEIVDENYIIYSHFLSNGEFALKLFCVNPSRNLQERMQKGRSTILFSATLLPIQYYKKLLGAEEGDYEVYAQSTFQEEKRALFLASDVTSKYTRRTDAEYERIACYINEIVQQRYGNYMIFFPSHAFLQRIYEVFAEKYYDETYMECVVQEDYMNEADREAFLQRFQVEEVQPKKLDCIQMNIEVEDKCLIGFCVLGGIFSEGIDLRKDSLIGALVVGTGIPQVCSERELLKKFFDAQGENGYDYAYRYPGMNKVLQSAGRVIRTAEDIGIIALLDERFLTASYQRLFPREWNSYQVVTVDTIGKRTERFWNEWL